MDGKLFDLEMHIVHVSDDERHCTGSRENGHAPCLAVVGMLFMTNKEYAVRHNLAEAKYLEKLL